MTITEWRKNKQLVAGAMGLLQSEVGQRMIDCLEQSSPLHLPVPLGPGYDPGPEHSHSFQLGIILGYAKALENLRTLGQKLEPLRSEPKMTYPTPNL